MAYHDIAGTIEGVNDATQMEYDQDDEFGELGARRKRRASRSSQRAAQPAARPVAARQKKRRIPGWVKARCRGVVHHDTIELAEAYRGRRLRGMDPVIVLCAKLAYKALRRGDCRNADKYAALAEAVHGSMSTIEDQLALKY